ncbi:histidine phosphatase family protein [Neokomagataea thailandica]|uniref:Phosphoglycerate mutase n=1 Tax=Neokomagataea tanensis NBRC 106556 TaxID=1223519 RepID=A0ABQ0QJC5_9PROT|nr:MULTISPECIES: histidine phosphatase family protein [Neokomagataea]GBR46723.1 phosphoglycerate mutase [Neokomagataea tanensis NBRC 106556]
MSDASGKVANETHGHFLDEPDLPGGVTRFWLIRHAVVEAEARKVMYGALDVALCAETMVKQKAGYHSLARRLPQGALWVSSPLMRAQETAQALRRASGHEQEPLRLDERFIEQSIGDWHGTPHAEFPSLLSLPPNPFWSLAATETPPSGESMVDVGARVGRALEERASAHAGRDTVIVSHGGAIRAALAHALQVHPETALRFSIQNLSLSIIERIDGLWRVVKVNELPDFRE